MKQASDEATSPHVLIGKSSRTGSEPYLSGRDLALTRLAVVGGAALAIIGATDVALLWFPVRFGNAEWEFATVSATLESLPLAAFGFGLLAAGAIVRKGKASLYFLATIFILLTLLVLGSTGLFALDIPLAYKAAPEALKGQLRQHFLKTAVLALSYLFLFGYLAWMTLGNARSKRTA